MYVPGKDTMAKHTMKYTVITFPNIVLGKIFEVNRFMMTESFLAFIIERNMNQI